MQRYSLSSQRPEHNHYGAYVKLTDVQALLRKIADDASPSTTAGQLLVSESVLDKAYEEAGLNRQGAT